MRPSLLLVSVSLRVLLGVCLAGAAGCGDPPPQPGPGGVTLGTVDPRLNGDNRWVDIVDGQDAELHPGAQGGFHIWLLYRTAGVSGSVVVRRQSDRVAPDSTTQRVLTTQGVQQITTDPWQLPSPIPNFTCPTPIGVNVIDQPIEMSVRIEDQAGTALATGRARVVARCPPVGDPQREFCLMICSG